MQKNKREYAPVFVTVYDRPSHFKRCIESLSKNIYASETTLFISSDGPKDSQSLERITMVRDHIKNISGFKRVIPFTAEENTGGAIRRKVRDRVYDFSDRYIFSEDDNVFSPHFLGYMNSALDIYEDDDRIRAISGYMYPGFPSKQLRPILMKVFAAWGVGLWRDKDVLTPDFNQITFAKEIFADRELFNKINYGLPHIASMLKQIAEGQLIAADVTRSALLFKYDWYCVFPSKSMVRNIGNDGTGEHCGVNSTYSDQEICDAEMNFDGSTLLEFDESHQDWIRKYFGGRSAIMRNKLIFFEMNASSEITRRLWHLAYLSTGLSFRVLGRLKLRIKQTFSA